MRLVGKLGAYKDNQRLTPNDTIETDLKTKEHMTNFTQTLPINLDYQSLLAGAV